MKLASLVSTIVTATFLVLAVACSAESEVDCASGETRDCGVCPTQYPYVGCGELGPAVAMAIEGTELCTGEGTWGRCSCLVDTEPECASEPGDHCVQECSRQMRSLAFLVPTNGDELLCRQAYVALLECAGESCGWLGDPGTACAVELEELDLQCLGLSWPDACL